MAEDRLCLNLNLYNKALTQFVEYNFNSFCEFNGLVLGANEDGIYSLDGDDDDGSDIDAFFEVGPDQLGRANHKRLRRAYFTGEFEGDMTLTVKNDESNSRTYQAKPSNKTMLEHEFSVNIGRDGIGYNWWFRVDNLDGCDFSIDAISLLVLSMIHVVR